MSGVSEASPRFHGSPNGLGPPIFIVGFPRSGTSLMKSLLTSHPDIAMLPFETHLLTGWARDFGMDLSDPDRFSAFWAAFAAEDRLQHEHLPKQVILDCLRGSDSVSIPDVLDCMLQTYALMVGGSRPGEKTPDHYKHIDLLLSWFPGCQVIFMLRDPRGVLASWFDWDRRWTERPAAAILGNWIRSVYAMERWSEHPAVLGVRYEDLVVEPEGEISRILDFLGLQFPEGILEREGSGRLHGKYDRTGPVEAGSVERWRTRLSTEEVVWVEREVAAEMKRHGYEPRYPLTRPDRLRAEARRVLFKSRFVVGSLREELAARRGESES